MSISIKTLKADLQLARIKHRANPSEATLEALEKAKNAYDLAVSEQTVSDEKTEDLATKSKISETTGNEHITRGDRQEPIDSLTGFTPAELAEFKQAVDAFLRGPSNAKAIGIFGSNVGRSIHAATSPCPGICICPAANKAVGAGEVDRLPSDAETAHSEHEAGAGSVDEKTTTEAPHSEPVTTQLAEPDAAPSPAVAEPAKPAKVSTGTSKGKANSEQKKTKETAK